MTTPTVLCFKWGKGYSPRYTNVLHRAARDLTTGPLRFCCMTDDPTGLDPEIETLPFPTIAMPKSDWHKGMWPKLCAFAPDLFPEGTPVLMLDVDIVLLGGLDPFFKRLMETGQLHIARAIPDTLPRLFPRLFGKPPTSNSSVVGFLAGTQTHLFTEFAEQTRDSLAPLQNDQDYIHARAKDRHHWPDGDVLSFKRNCVYHFPLNLIRGVPKPDGRIVIFHGKPDPEDVVQPRGTRWGTAEKFGYTPVAWVAEYWHRYASSSE